MSIQVLATVALSALRGRIVTQLYVSFMLQLNVLPGHSFTEVLAQ